MKFSTLGVIVLLLLFVSSSIIAQQSQKNEAVVYSDKKISEVLKDLQTKTGINIYFKEDDLPESLVSVRGNVSDLEKMLKEMIAGSLLKVVDYRGSFFVVKALPSEVTKDNLSDEIEKAQLLADFSGKVIKLEGTPSKTGKNILTLDIKDVTTKEEIIGAAVSVNKKLTTVTDVDGKAVITLRNGMNVVGLTYLGYKTLELFFEVSGESDYTVRLERESQIIDEVVISGIGSGSTNQETQSGVSRVDIKALERIPTFLGERDVVKAVLLNPGVSSVGEGASGFNVRGGNVDQNLVIQDDAILFNSSHALGFFSTFNADMIKTATLHKGAINSQYGGRLSSVLDVQTKDGADKLKYKANINILSSTGTIEAPLFSGVSILLSGRTTYSNLIFKIFPQEEVKNSSAGFYDLNGKLNIKMGNTALAVSGYYSDDNFAYNNEFGFDYSTKIAQASLRTFFSDNFTNKLSVVWSDYISDQNEFDNEFSTTFRTKINYLKGHNKFTAKFGKIITDIGLVSTMYNVSPGEFRPFDENSLRIPEVLDDEKGMESALYISSEIPVTTWLELVLGYRINQFVALGPKKINIFKDNVLLKENLEGQELKEGTIKSFTNPEPRLSIKISPWDMFSIKGGYGRTSQFINQIFNTDVPTPSSQWQMVNHVFQPGIADNFSAGIFLGNGSSKYEFSAEVFKRELNNVFDYKDYADLFVNPTVETELLQGKGESQGLELSIKKNKGKLNGFISYTYSLTMYQIPGVNNGKEYFANYDQPHNVSVILNYQPIEKNTFTANFTYRSGRPTTAPISSYTTFDGIYVPIYSDRNALRIPDTHRLDLSANFGRTHNKAARVKTSWTFTVYNVYGRKNPFSVFYNRGTFDVPTPQANRLAIVGTMFPAISFNIEFD